MCYCCDKTTIISRKRLQRWFLVAFGLALPAQQPTGHRFCLTKLRTGNSCFWEYIHGLTKVAQLGLFFRVQIRAHFSENLDHACSFFFSLSDSLYFSRFIMSSIDSDCWEILFFKIPSIYRHLSNLENTNWNSSIFKDFEQLSQTPCYPGESERHKL